MKLRDIDIQNFLAIGTAKIVLADRGLVLVQGINADESSADSNGAGKSSFADAVSWVNYGLTARGESGDNVINRFVGKNCRVMEHVEDGDDLYEITRHRKHKVGKNALWIKKIDRITGEVIADLTQGTDTLTQRVLTKILGCSYEVFVGSIYAGQERLPDLPGMTDKNLKMLIEEASGATLLEAAYNEAQARLRTKKSEVDIIANKVERQKNAVDVAITTLTDAQEGETKFEADRLEVVKRIHAVGITAKASIEEFKTKIAADDIPGLRVGIKGFDVAIAAVTDERAAEAALIEKRSTVGRLLARHDAEIQGLETAVKRDIAALDHVDHRIGCPCDTCARPYTDADIAPARKLAQDKLKATKDELARAKSQRGPAAADVLSVTDALEKHRATMTDVSAVNAMRAELDSKLRAALSNESALKSKIEGLNSLIKQIKDKKAEVNPFTRRIEAAQKALTLAESGLKGFQSDLELVTAGLKVAETVAKVFSPAGVRAFLLDEVTPFLNDQTAKYLGTLSDGNITATWTTLVKTTKGELREKFSIEVDNVNGGGTFGLISGGEKRKVRIACALALQDLVARRATKPIELFIGDEIDDALDPAGIERLTTILEEKARERGSVFVISHSNLKDWIRNTITVTRKDKLATLTETAS